MNVLQNFIAGRDLAASAIRSLRAAGAEACSIQRGTYALKGPQPQALHEALRTVVAKPELLHGFAATLTDVLGNDGGVADIEHLASLTPRQMGVAPWAA